MVRKEKRGPGGRDFHLCYSERHYLNTPVFYGHKGVTPSNEHAAVNADSLFQIGCNCHRGSGRGAYCFEARFWTAVVLWLLWQMAKVFACTGRDFTWQAAFVYDDWSQLQ